MQTATLTNAEISSADLLYGAATCLERGADPDARLADDTGNTPLHLCALKQHVEMAELLLSFVSSLAFRCALCVASVCLPARLCPRQPAAAQPLVLRWPEHALSADPWLLTARCVCCDGGVLL